MLLPGRRAALAFALALVAVAACGDNLHGPDADVCGDNAITGTEVCDGIDLGGATCVSRGFPGGTLACAGDCIAFDETGCDRPIGCGDGVLAAGETCDDGNATPGDGCELNCQIGAGPVTTCRVVTPLAVGVCAVTAGNGAKLISGTVLAPDKVWRGGQVLVNATGTIACTGCDCSTDPAAAGATAIDCPGGVISPGLINPHDHITFTQNSPYTDTGERYEHRHEWRSGLNGHTEINAAGGASAAQIRWGELRFLLGGATSTVGSGSATGILRNLDTNNQEGLGQPPVDFETFPLGDSNSTQRSMDCNYPNVVTAAAIAGDDAYFPHVSEGVDQRARNEFLCLSSTTYDTTAPGVSSDIVLPQSAFIHGIGLQAPDIAQMASDGTALIWSPRSNITLYGDTAPITEAAAAGALIALGTDWTPTGSMNLLRELACADSLNADYYGGYFTDAELWKMVTINPAVAAAMEDAIGSLAAGRVADITIFDGATGVDHRAVIAAEAQDVVLVMRGGSVLYGDDAVVSAITPAGCDLLPVCGVDKRVCLMADIGQSFAQLQTAAGSIYGAFFCGPPDNEPSCVPRRPVSVNGSTIYDGTITGADPDGDGIATGDNCPTVFNPVRPVDGGAQADFDGDTVGDVCDVCPLDANSTTCTPFDPLDPDGDGIPTGTDNCPNLANPTQADADGDGKGDVCDPCPNQPNPGAAACTATIYQIKDGTVPAGNSAALVGVLVTGRNASGFFVQVKETDTGYVGPDNSGLFVFQPASTVAVGDRVDIASGNVQNFFGQIQLSGVTGVTVTASGESPPAPIVELPVNVATGGSRAAALESVIVRVETVTVTDVSPAPGAGDTPPTNEFVVAASLRINDYLYLTTPFPTVGTIYVSLTGVLQFRNNNSKLEPRGPTDVVTGAPVLQSFGPAMTFTRVGAIDQPTIPNQLTVTLSGPALAATFVAITPSNAALAVTGGGVTIPMGAVFGVVQVSGLTAGTTTLTATLAATMLTADVRILDGTEQPVLVDLTPATAQVAPGGSLTMSVSLDIPAPAGGTLVDLSATAGTVPATVTVAQDQVTATFMYTAPASGTAMIMASLGPTTLMAMITVAAGGGALVINEVDYDQIGTDTTELIEIYNGTGAAVDLTNLAVVLINGSNNLEYRRVDLVQAGASLAAGAYLVISNANVTVPGGTPQIILTVAMDIVQNGAPDGVALVDVTTQTLIDALSYEGSITAGVVTGFVATVNLVEGTALPASTADSNTAVASLSRLPNGTDTNNAATDWVLSSTPTPGAANQ